VIASCAVHIQRKGRLFLKQKNPQLLYISNGVKKITKYLLKKIPRRHLVKE